MYQKRLQSTDNYRRNALLKLHEFNQNIINGVLDQVNSKSTEKILSILCLKLFFKVMDYSEMVNANLRIKNIMSSNDWIFYAQLMSNCINNIDDNLGCFRPNQECITLYRGFNYSNIYGIPNEVKAFKNFTECRRSYQSYLRISGFTSLRGYVNPEQAKREAENHAKEDP